MGPIMMAIVGGIASRLAKGVTSRVVENTIGRVVPEVVNAGRKVVARETGTVAVPIQSEKRTLKGARTLISAVVLIGLYGLEYAGYYAASEQVYEVVINILVGSFALKAAD